MEALGGASTRFIRTPFAPFCCPWRAYAQDFRPLTLDLQLWMGRDDKNKYESWQDPNRLFLNREEMAAKKESGRRYRGDAHVGVLRMLLLE
jgi:hypothetical protein